MRVFGNEAQKLLQELEKAPPPRAVSSRNVIKDHYRDRQFRSLPFWGLFALGISVLATRNTIRDGGGLVPWGVVGLCYLGVLMFICAPALVGAVVAHATRTGLLTKARLERIEEVEALLSREPNEKWHFVVKYPAGDAKKIFEPGPSWDWPRQIGWEVPVVVHPRKHRVLLVIDIRGS
jgi:hypothetical protein